MVVKYGGNIEKGLVNSEGEVAICTEIELANKLGLGATESR